MGYFYDNNIRKVPGPVYVYDYIFTDSETLPSQIVFTSAGNVYNSITSNPWLEKYEAEERTKIRAGINGVAVGRYMLFSPSNPENTNIASFAGTIWQKVIEAKTTKFVIVADRYTNPVDGITGLEMKRIWEHVAIIENENITEDWKNGG